MRSRGRRACLCTALLETFTPAPVQSEREEVKLATALGKAAAEKQAAAPAPSASAPSAAAPTTWRSFFGQQANKPAEYAVPAAVGALKAADKPAGAPLTLSKEVRTHRTLGGGGGPSEGPRQRPRGRRHACRLYPLRCALLPLAFGPAELDLGRAPAPSPAALSPSRPPPRPPTPSPKALDLQSKLRGEPAAAAAKEEQSSFNSLRFPREAGALLAAGAALAAGLAVRSG